MFKKHKWTPYGRKANSLDINVKDRFEQSIDFVRLEKGRDIDNKRMLKRIERYGFDLNSLIEKKDNSEEHIEKEKKEDVDWLKKGDW